MNLKWLISRDGRKWIYGVCLAAVPLLVAYGVLEKDDAPLWIALIGAVVAPALALANLTPDQQQGDIEIPEDLV